MFAVWTWGMSAVVSSRMSMVLNSMSSSRAAGKVLCGRMLERKKKNARKLLAEARGRGVCRSVASCFNDVY